MEKRHYDNMDLLKCISMYMVVILHALGNGKVLIFLETGTMNWVIGNFIDMCCIIAVNCFALISGFFLCKSEFKLSRIADLWTMCVFWSVVLYLLSAFVFCTDTFSMVGIIQSVLVFTWKPWWYVTQYMLLYFCMPLFNSAIHAMPKQRHLACCLIAVFLFSILPTITIYGSDFSGVGTGFSFIWLACLYLISAYIRFYIPEPEKIEWKWLGIYVCCSVVMYGEIFLRNVVDIPGKLNILSCYNSIICFVSSLSLFLFFRGIRIGSILIRKMVNKVAPLTLAVFLIHHFPQLKVLLWDFFKPYAYTEEPWMLVYVLAISALIFTVCIIAEKMRQVMFDITGLNKLIKKISERIQQLVENLINRLT